MSLTSGFFDSKNNDRVYSSEQFSSIFDGLINDGVFQSLYDKFYVTAKTGRNVTVGAGKAWLMHTWVLNNAEYPILLGEASLYNYRYDAIVLDIDRSENVRDAVFRVVEGPEFGDLSHPSYPALINTPPTRRQYVIAYIRRVSKNARPSEEIQQQDIFQQVGTTDTPFVTGILETLDISSLYNQYQSQVTTLISQLEQNIADASSTGVLDLSVTTPKIAQKAVTREKLANDALYSPVVRMQSTPYAVSQADIGKTLSSDWALNTSNVVVDITEAMSNALPDGTELAFHWMFGASYSITLHGIRIGVQGEGYDTKKALTTVTIDERNTMVALKKILSDSTLGDIWLLTGSAEVSA